MGEVRVLEDQRRPFFTTESLARYICMSERYVRELLKSGEIASYTFGRARRIDPAEVDSWLAKQRDRRAA